ncbi:glycosyltransferase family 9 protein [Mucilaginibacter defluvii]|uniref:Lipopolysaccharide heptosyltransferase II n=1 Tax=Mucilaginibacter defluvii TaxID=1196019 RepID=A0ABP9G7H1_9SPHI
MNWSGCKNILCIRPDNMGDLLMSGPAIRALKHTFNARITVLTSSMAAVITPFMPEIDEVLIFDVPWVKSSVEAGPNNFAQTVELLKARQFDAAVIFTVFSQNPLPSAMLAYLAGIPKVLAYCRENPYQLINCWVPEKEPYQFIKHQVQRDLDLVASVGAHTTDSQLQLKIDQTLWESITQMLNQELDTDTNKPWMILHPGVSEKKREYPPLQWALTGKELVKKGYQLLITGSASERRLTDELASAIGHGAVAAGGKFSLQEFICLIAHSPLLLSVNTGTIHIAAATQTPVVVLYAQTNPQHTPWQVPHIVLPFSIPDNLKSNNQVIVHLDNTVYNKSDPMPLPEEILNAVEALMGN